ncbi:MAG: hypothetical protein FWD23_14910 [Oscillospiraceae bacterium]|nr:hypothetical protein [Oscillospiraceae bacterium]
MNPYRYFPHGFGRFDTHTGINGRTDTNSKKSGDANEINGLAKGTPLAGAIFEVYNYKTGNLVGRYKCDAGGKDYNGEWVVSQSTWLTTIYAKQNQYPKTGY